MATTWAELSSALVPFGIPQHEIDWRNSQLVQWKELSQKVDETQHQISDVDRKFLAIKEKRDEKAYSDAIKTRKELQSKREALKIEMDGYDQLVYEKPWRTIDAALNKVLSTAARTSCQVFTSNIDRCLPRELRDMIYMQLLGDHTIDPIIRLVKKQINQGCCTDQPCPSFDLAPFLNLEFVPSKVITEIIQMAAETSSLMTRVHSLAALEEFPRYRALHYDFPASRFFRRLVIFLDFHQLLGDYRLTNKSYSAAELELLQYRLKRAFKAIPPRRDRRLDIKFSLHQFSFDGLGEWAPQLCEALMKPCFRMLDERVARGEFASVNVLREK